MQRFRNRRAHERDARLDGAQVRRTRPGRGQYPRWTAQYCGPTLDLTYASAYYATISYDAATGTRLWVRRYHGAGTHDDSANAMTVSPAGKVLVTGSSWGATSNEDCATIAYSLAGSSSPGPPSPAT